MPGPLGPADPCREVRASTKGGHGLLAVCGPTKAYARAQERRPALSKIAGKLLGSKLGVSLISHEGHYPWRR
ncbi:hypothetical protein ACH4CE_18665 [Streptomyces gelaticus]|uniref:hypothetical protein n=1 Tax=Streptomyces gelaticus TaxID=285446 RepID=UPI0037A1686F